MEETEKTSIKPSNSGFTTLAAYLMEQDFKYILLALPILALPALANHFIDACEPVDWIYLILLDRVLVFCFLNLVSFSWAKRLNEAPMQFRFSPVNLFGTILWGFALMFSFLFPFLLFQGLMINWVGQIVFFLLLAMGVFALLRYYFYFIPLSFDKGQIFNALPAASFFTRLDTWAAVKVCVAPLGISYLLMLAFLTPFPDGREPLLVLLSNVAGVSLYIFATYLGIAFALLAMPYKERQRLGIEEGRYQSLVKASEDQKAFWSGILEPKNGAIFLALSLMLWFGNLNRLGLTAPAVGIEVAAADIHGEYLDLVLDLKDEDYHFNGFQPMNFVLAGPTKALVSERPEFVETFDSKQDARFCLPSNLDSAKVRVRFKVNRQGEELKKLKDLYLWYRNSKILLLDLSEIRVNKI